MEVKPEQIEKLRKIDAGWPVAIASVVKHVPDCVALICYGSRVYGYAKPKSDYDILAVTHNPWPWTDQWDANAQVVKETGAKVNLGVISRDGLKTGQLMSPFLHLVLRTGIVIGETGDIPVLPISRLGLENVLGNCRIELEEKDLYESMSMRCEQLLKAIRDTIALEQVLDNHHDPQALHKNLAAVSKKCAGNAPCLEKELRRRIEALETRLLDIPPNAGDRAVEAILYG
ncbi:MAG: nucleotidyltransferase domain-containing protein [Peptococcaceae bacterium]|nr:nucleotidyltransferase domain-containing protein [Peptococcaceae bacterium]